MLNFVQLKRDPSDAEFAAFMKQIDVNEDGKVTLEEYVKWLHGDDWLVDGVPVCTLVQPHLLTFILGCRVGHSSTERCAKNAHIHGSTPMRMQSQGQGLPVLSARKT